MTQLHNTMMVYVLLYGINEILKCELFLSGARAPGELYFRGLGGEPVSQGGISKTEKSRRFDTSRFHEPEGIEIINTSQVR